MARRAACVGTLAFTLSLAHAALAQDEPVTPPPDAAVERETRSTGYWPNARKACQFASIARVTPDAHAAKVFYLDKDELPEATCIRLFAHRGVSPARDGLNVYSVRAYTAPLPQHRSRSFEFKYAHERNTDEVRSNAWSLATGVIVYQFFADQPTAYGSGVTARNIAVEVNAYTDRTISDNVVLRVVGGAADPGETVRQASGRTADFALGMVYLAYKY